MRTLLLALLLPLAGGCVSTRTYRAVIHNTAPEPITVGFVKDGPVLEERWASPEVLSNLPASRMPMHWGVVVPPAQVRALQVEGKFEGSTHAFLRVYAGAPTTDELLAKSEGTGGRMQLQLNQNGDNEFVIGEDDHGRLYAHLRRFDTHYHNVPPAAPTER